ncbi:MAG TPA: ClpXP protease specificity-enhancing factor SspB [Xanthobacteraceae bacterium]|nr:ClpXP protease specificity-enhancing factor SspB [Xanthobacteraceae bacterium]
MADLIRYDLLAQDALRGIVRKVLADVARARALPGDHHFFIEIDTNAPGLKISDRLRAANPDKITIVLQHQFWDLTVTEQGFEVGLSFGGAPERLSVPFTAVNGFYDPSVQFGLKFVEEKPAEAATETPEPKPATAPRGAASEPEERPAKKSVPRKKAPALAAVAAPDVKPAGAQILSIDKFRKKKS